VVTINAGGGTIDVAGNNVTLPTDRRHGRLSKAHGHLDSFRQQPLRRRHPINAGNWC